MTWSLDADDSLLDAALAERPRVVSLSFGDPAPYVERVHAAGALAVSQVNTLDDLHVVERAGVDFVIAQAVRPAATPDGSAPCRCCRRSSTRRTCPSSRRAESAPAVDWRR